MGLFRKKTIIFDEPIEKILEEMRQHGHETEEYKLALSQLKTLIELKNECSSQISPNTVLVVAGNLLIVMIVVAYEQKHVLTLQMKSFIQLLRPGT